MFGQAGVPDEDCPDMVSENYYWVTTTRKVTEQDKISSTGTFKANVTPTAGCLDAFSNNIAPKVEASKPLAPGVHNDLMAHVAARAFDLHMLLLTVRLECIQDSG